MAIEKGDVAVAVEGELGGEGEKEIKGAKEKQEEKERERRSGIHTYIHGRRKDRERGKKEERRKEGCEGKKEEICRTGESTKKKAGKIEHNIIPLDSNYAACQYTGELIIAPGDAWARKEGRKNKRTEQSGETK
jgi:hypothetical protein